jgi:Concanavalin A-like lectin/glucanases superfamily/Camelysin metallo-endopeptidase
MAGFSAPAWRRVIGSAGVLVLLVGVSVYGTVSAFSGTTANAGSSFAAGTVVLSDDDAETAMFSMTGLKPGSTQTRCINVAYTGSLAALVRLHASVTGSGLADFLDVVVTRGSFSTSPGGGSCTGFTGDPTDYLGRGAGVVWDGRLGHWPDGWTNGLNDPDDMDAESWTTGEQHAYRFTVTLADVQAAQGAGATTTFTWEARNGALAASYGDAVRDSAPVGWWRLDERSGSTAADRSGNGHDATLAGTYQQGFGGVLADGRRAATRFGGSGLPNDASASAGDHFDFAGNAPFTLETWIRPESLDWHHQVVVMKGEPPGCCTNRNGWYLWVHNSQGVGLERFRDEAKDTCATNQVPAVDAWSHLAVTYDGADIRIYRNGQLEAICGDTRVLRDTSAAVVFATWPGQGVDHHFHGSLDEVAVYDRALGGAEVAAHFAAVGG